MVKDDANHQLAKAVYPALTGRRRITTTLVLAETYTWLRYHVGFEAAVTFADRMLQDEAAQRIVLVRPDRPLEERALALLRRFADVPLSWADAVSFAVVAAYRLHDVFGFDRHFLLMGCQLLPLAPQA